MKIYLASDIHVEFHKDFSGPTEPVDVIVLAGDIHIGLKSINVAKEFQQKYNAPVILIAGNHEFYNSDIDNMLNEFRMAATAMDHVYFLENDAIEIQGVRFLGCTLWSNFELHTHASARFAKKKATQFISDFDVIRHKGGNFTPDDAVSRFEESYAWLEQELAKSHDGDTVVITHFAPHRATIHPDYLIAGSDELTPYFTVDCSKLMQRHPIKAWFYGHNHNSVDIVVENSTRVVSNQRGYPGERWTYTRFDAQKIIEI